MDRLFSPEFWNQHLTFVSANAEIIIPVIVVSMAIGWWLRGAVVKGEIAGLERAIDKLEQRVRLAHEKSP
jgi:hypothetical protein